MYQRPHRQTARQRARAHLAMEAQADVLTYVFDPDGFYSRLADRLLDTMPWRYRWLPGHWVCAALNKLANRIDPGTYAHLIRHPIREGLLSLRTPSFIANALGATSAFGLKLALAQLPTGQFILALRVLGALTCPDLAQCPSQRDIAKAFVAPALTERLKMMA